MLATLLLLSIAQVPPAPLGTLKPHDLQGRIDRARPGSTLVVPAGSWKAIVIDKPLTLIGDEGAVIYSDQEYGPDPFPAPITLDGPGHGTVTLANLDTVGSVDGHLYSSIAGGIAGGGFETLELQQCRIEAPVYWRWHLTCAGGPGISVDVEHVLVVDSEVLASEGRHDFCGYARGAAGIDAPSSSVEIFGSTVVGASFVDPCMLEACPDSLTMEEVAGPGVRARCLVGSAFGASPRFWRSFHQTGELFWQGDWVDCNYGPAGATFVKTGRCTFVQPR